MGKRYGKYAAAAAALLMAGILVTGCADKEEENFPTLIVTPIESTETAENTESREDTAPTDSEEMSSSEQETASEETKESGAKTEPKDETDKVITQRKVVNGKMQSYLTGEWKDASVAKRRSMAVMMPNDKKALPQYGISKASIIYEAPVEGRITRLMAFYEDYDDLDHIGPVRSSRDYYVYEAMAYDAIYCNWGLARPFVEELINSDRIDNISQAVAGIKKPAAEVYDRINRKGYALEYTGYLFPAKYTKAVERLGYEKEYRDTFVQAFTFAADDYPAEYKDKESAVRIYPGGTEANRGGYGSSNPCFEYRAKDGLYYRSQYGEAQIDEMNGEQLAVTNVVFKICHGEVREPKGKDYLAFGVHGEGDAIVFTAGRVIKGTWKRSSDTDPNLFLDENGEEIIFNQGKTWICNIWKEYAEYIEYE